MNDTHTITCKCPACGHKFDAATGISDDHTPPSAGDVSICIKCGALGIFNADLSVRAPTHKEKMEASLLPELIQSQIWIRGRQFQKQPKETHAN